MYRDRALEREADEAQAADLRRRYADAPQSPWQAGTDSPAQPLDDSDLALDSFNEHRERRRGEEEQSAYLRRLER